MGIVREGYYDLPVLIANTAPKETSSPFEKGVFIFGEETEKDKYLTTPRSVKADPAPLGQRYTLRADATGPRGSKK